ncbi:MAG: hypothetical protein ABFC34_10760 [Methanobacterium sp.]
MINREYIEKNIDIIFDIEKSNLKKGIMFSYVEGSDESIKRMKDSNRIFYPARPPYENLELKPSDNFRLKWDTFTNLKKLYTKIEHLPGCRNLFISTLERKLSKLCAIDTPTYTYSLDIQSKVLKGFSLHSDASLAFYFLLKIGSNDSIIRALQTKMNKSMYFDKYTDSRSGENIDFEAINCVDDIEGLFRDVLVFLHLEPTYFDESLLDQLTEIMHCNYSELLIVKEAFEDEILSLRYNRLINELEDSNEEINIHKEQVIGIISKYGFPQEMETYLLEIDKLPEFTDLQALNSGMISTLRSFFEAMIKNIAGKINTKTGIEYPMPKENEKEMGIKRRYIKEHLRLSDEDNKLINSVVDILNKKGSHAFLSEKRYFKVTKNICIEIAYFLLSIYVEKFERTKMQIS